MELWICGNRFECEAGNTCWESDRQQNATERGLMKEAFHHEWGENLRTSEISICPGPGRKRD